MRKTFVMRSNALTMEYGKAPHLKMGIRFLQVGIEGRGGMG